MDSISIWINIVSLVINNAVVISIAFFTYKYINKRSVCRQINQEEVAKTIIKSIYANCRSDVDLFDIERIAESIIKKTNFDQPIIETDPFNRFVKNAFADEPVVIESFKQGVLNGKILEDYMAMKSSYRNYLICRITFFDAPEAFKPLREEFEDKYIHGLSGLETKK